MTVRTAPAFGRTALSKVPEVTLAFWVVKVLATTVGETAADGLDSALGLGLTGTALVMSALLVAALGVQLTCRSYVPAVYWVVVVLVSVVGTLVTDQLVDGLGVSLRTTTAGFAVALAAVFAAWWASERTLSIHTVTSGRREAWYWLAILVTFALGTAAGDLLAEGLHLGYAVSAVLFAACLAAVWVAHARLGLGAVLAFWTAYVLTRPLGASLGDLLSQERSAGGLGLGTTLTSAAFLLVIVAVVVHLTRHREAAS